MSVVNLKGWRTSVRVRLRRHHRRHHTLAYLTLAVVAFAVALPLIIVSRNPGPVYRPPAQLAEARDSYSLSAPVRLVPAVGLTLDAGSISIAPSQAASARTGEAILTLLTGGNARLILEGAVFTFAPAAAGQPDPSNPAGALQPLLVSLTEARFESLVIHHGKVTMQRSDGSTIDLLDLNAEVSLRRKGSVAAKGTFEYRGETLSFDTSFGLSDRKTVSRVPFRADIKGDLIELSLEGRASLGDSIQVSSQSAAIAVADLRRTVAWLGKPWPGGAGFKKLSLSGHLDWVDSEAAFQSATLEMDGNVARGNLLLRFAGPRPAIEATLALEKLDLGAYLSAFAAARPGDDAHPTPPAHKEALPVAAGELAMPMIGLFDADVRLSADKLEIAQHSLGRTAAVLSMKAGRLFADIAEIEVSDAARVSGQIGIDATGVEQRFTLRGKGVHMDGAGFMSALTGTRMITGPIDFVFDLTASGETPTRFIGSLAGKAAMRMTDGGRLGVDLPELYATALTKAPTIGWGDAAGGYTSIENLLARFRISGGQCTAETFLARSGLAVYSGSGVINLAGRTLDLVVNRSLPKTQVGTGNSGDPGASIALRGPWREPALQLISRPPEPAAAPAAPAAPAATTPDATKPGRS